MCTGSKKIESSAVNEVLSHRSTQNGCVERAIALKLDWDILNKS